MNEFEIQISNYRSISKSKISISLNEINYFIGSNESGKTNFLKAGKTVGKNAPGITKSDEIRCDKSEPIKFIMYYGNKSNIIDDSLNQHDDIKRIYKVPCGRIGQKLIIFENQKMYTNKS